MGTVRPGYELKIPSLSELEQLQRKTALGRMLQTAQIQQELSKIKNLPQTSPAVRAFKSVPSKIEVLPTETRGALLAKIQFLKVHIQALLAKIKEFPRKLDNRIIEEPSKWFEEKKQPDRNQITESEGAEFANWFRTHEEAADLGPAGQQEVTGLDKAHKETAEGTFK